MQPWLVLFIVCIYFQQEHLDVTTEKTIAAPAKVKDDQIVMEGQAGQSEHQDVQDNHEVEGQVEVERPVNEEDETQNSSKNPLGKHMAYVQI